MNREVEDERRKINWSRLRPAMQHAYVDTGIYNRKVLLGAEE
jgi:hypothetical protein